MQTKVFDGSSVNDCLRPRRAVGCCPADGVSGSSAALSSVDPAPFSAVCCGADECWLVDSVAVDWADSLAIAMAKVSFECVVFLAFFGGLLFLGFILVDASSDVRRESGGVMRPTDANCSEASRSSKLSSLRNSSSSNGRSSRGRLLPRNTGESQGEKRVRSVIGSCSEPMSEKVSNVGRPPSVAAAVALNEGVK